jgi:phosphoglucomutase
MTVLLSDGDVVFQPRKVARSGLLDAVGYKIHAESFLGADHLRRILEEAQTIVNDALTAAPVRDSTETAARKHP